MSSLPNGSKPKEGNALHPWKNTDDYGMVPPFLYVICTSEGSIKPERFDCWNNPLAVTVPKLNEKSAGKNN